MAYVITAKGFERTAGRENADRDSRSSASPASQPDARPAAGSRRVAGSIGPDVAVFGGSTRRRNVAAWAAPAKVMSAVNMIPLARDCKGLHFFFPSLSWTRRPKSYDRGAQCRRERARCGVNTGRSFGLLHSTGSCFMPGNLQDKSGPSRRTNRRAIAVVYARVIKQKQYSWRHQSRPQELADAVYPHVVMTTFKRSINPGRRQYR